MEPRRETVTAAAESDRDLTDLKQRCEAWLEAADIEKAEAEDRGDMDRARELDNAKVEIQEILGMIRYHPYTAAAQGGTRLLKPPAGIRDSLGKYTEKGTQGHFASELDSLGQLQPPAPKETEDQPEENQLRTEKSFGILRNRILGIIIRKGGVSR